MLQDLHRDKCCILSLQINRGDYALISGNMIGWDSWASFSNLRMKWLTLVLCWNGCKSLCAHIYQIMYHFFLMLLLKWCVRFSCFFKSFFPLLHSGFACISRHFTATNWQRLRSFIEWNLSTDSSGKSDLFSGQVYGDFALLTSGKINHQTGHK